MQQAQQLGPETVSPDRAGEQAAERAAGSVARAVPRVLSIAGTDPTGGAGIQADLKSIAAHGGYGMAVVTALVAQNTCGVRSVHTPPADFLREQLQAVSDDVVIDAVKIGMLGDAVVVQVVKEWLEQVRPPVVVLDPVMVATSNDRLLRPEAEDALRGLLPLVHLVTPNLPELAVLLDAPVAADWAQALAQGRELSRRYGLKVLVKGGHLQGADSPDALVDAAAGPGQDLLELFSHRVDTANTHGTGCSLSAAMATVQARTLDWPESLRRVKHWLTGALERSDELEVGRGHGPIHHFHHLQPASGQAFSSRLWGLTAGVREAIMALPFIQELSAGTLDEDDFGYYLAQDARYLNGYSRVLARASALAPTEAEQLFWAKGAHQCLEVEAELHRSWLSGRGVSGEFGPVTKQYVDHLQAIAGGGSYGELVAAVIPCYWLYAHVGEQLSAQHSGGPADGHPYGAWLRTYADEAFAEASRQAVAIMDAAAAAESEAGRLRMRTAFEQSCRYELDFFDAPRVYARSRVQGG
ncbi:bifunctional hydroxymethylpyrimidine kinase/phosphomethylpyrimidine kinase [Arthrobacter sp. I2-34]|uniref:Bifunctional hydroxymethylpyrimidine kinase/phosphomethylpyrimidine kinase n=1 Tax=Arthrobacter hankyongi TaxID=2904801 RepID=A0ABS9LD76_9MICC|nr:bifunctional hydroxymethylpyrimidine kinase/phosphomethylpyrimidine kinase [Arthrobacter hankyongi]MCG2624397.1 bifunctional hydroxymethylpyrimidine kinase/phosphomethylpyrimidine kinase [Arthrobacter hankyongi]